MPQLEVIDGGLFSTIQDLGRPGFRKYGVPVSGVMDEKAYRLANELVENDLGAPVLELTMKGGKYMFKDIAVIVLTGADMTPKVNGKPIPMNACVKLEAGSELELGFSSRGCRSYLAIAGGIQVPDVMGSASTYTIGSFGGFKGRKLEAGDILNWTDTQNSPQIRAAKVNQIPYYSSKVTVRVMQGPEWDWLSKSAQRQFEEMSFEVGSSSSRMGIRLEGEPIGIESKQMVSSPVIPGIIQLPENGKPIVLMKDAQTIGGYPRIAKVLDEDLWRLGQVKPGDVVRFSFGE